MQNILTSLAGAGLTLFTLAALTALAPAQHPDLEGTPPTDALCLTCHDDVREAIAKAPHKALERGCVSCHDVVSKTAQTPFLRLDPNPLCMACHHVPLPPGAVPPASIEIAQGFVVPGSFLPRIRQLNLDKRGLGHPVANHPIAGPSDPRRKGRAFGCLSCHLPHGSESPKLLAFKLAPGEGICSKCHQM